MTYRIVYLESVVREDILKLFKAAKQQVRKAIENKLPDHPIEFGRPLPYSLKGARRIRVGDYRVIYRIETPSTVVILNIGHRRELYED